MTKCDMHLFWVAIYDRSEHMHRDPVANVVIYSALALFGACLGLIFGVPTYLFLRDEFPCVAMSNHVHDSTMDSCHFILAFAVACFTIVVSVIGIIAGELHKPLVYSIFGGMGFVACWAELYAFSSIITMIVLEENRALIGQLDNANLVNGLGGAAVAGHGLALFAIILAVRYAWKINFHFTRQDKLVYAEQLRQRKAKASGKDNLWHGVADLDDDHEFSIGGMQKGLAKMFDAKSKLKRQKEKQAELERIEEEEDRRVEAEQKQNLF